MSQVMTLTKLRDRLDNIIKENERRGWAERNNLPVYLGLYRGARKQSHYIPVDYVSGAVLGMTANGEKMDMMTLWGREAEVIWHTREGWRRKK